MVHQFIENQPPACWWCGPTTPNSKCRGARVRLFPHPDLKRVAEPVTAPLPGRVLEVMFEVAEAYNGVALAGPQLGIGLRVVVTTIPFQRVYLNPSWEPAGDKVKVEEGCLSTPGQYSNVFRYEAVTAKWLDEQMNPKEETLTGLAAQVVQHEVEHLDGKSWLDHLTSAERGRILGVNLKLIRKRGR